MQKCFQTVQRALLNCQCLVCACTSLHNFRVMAVSHPQRWVKHLDFVSLWLQLKINKFAKWSFEFHNKKTKEVLATSTMCTIHVSAFHWSREPLPCVLCHAQFTVLSDVFIHMVVIPSFGEKPLQCALLKQLDRQKVVEWWCKTKRPSLGNLLMNCNILSSLACKVGLYREIYVLS